jgi:hypothetical protein
MGVVSSAPQPASNGGFNWNSVGESAFDLLKFGISKKIDSERREEIVIREPTVQHEANYAGQVQQVGTIAGGVPDAVKYGGAALLALVGLGVIASIAR